MKKLGKEKMLTIKNITHITNTYRNLKRYEHIIQVICKYGFGDILESLRLENYYEYSRQLIQKSYKFTNHSHAERVRMALEELGPTFIKLGQILSTRPDLVGIEYAQELSKLQDSVPEFPFEDAAKVIEQEFGKTVEELFLSFEHVPLAAASIGQVHRAVTLSGEQVVVKIQRPGITTLIETDLEIMNHLALIAENHLTEAAIYKPTAIVSEFARTLEKEIDYNIEAQYTLRFARNFADNPLIGVPKVYSELSSQKVLTMEYVDGIKVSELRSHPDIAKYDLKVIAATGADAILEQVFIHGFFHADPHPGNIFILPDNRVCFLDFGMMGLISVQERHDFARLLSSIVYCDELRIMTNALKFVKYDKEPDMVELQRDLCDIVNEQLYRPVGDIKLSKVLELLLSTLSCHKLTLKPNIYIMFKALMTGEKIAHELDPELQIIERLKPFVSRLRFDFLRPEKLLAGMIEPLEDMLHTMTDIPVTIHSLLEKTRQGKLKFEFEHRGLEPLLRTLERVSDHVAYSIVLASLIIGSSLIVLSKIPPHWYGIPVIGIVGFMISGLIGFRVLLFPRRGKK